MKCAALMICIFIVFLHHAVAGQQRILYDSSYVHVRELSKDKINAYKKGQDFQYDKSFEPPRSLWDRFWEWFWSKVLGLLGRGAGSIFNTFFILAAIAIIVFFIVKVTGMKSAGLFGKKNTANKFPYSELDENIHDIQFDEAIQNAIDKKNFRLAVRLLYLQALKNLTDKGKINWQLNKTNFNYVQELRGTSHQSPFVELTKQFENNWYGNLPVPENEFYLLKQSFHHFNNQLY